MGTAEDLERWLTVGDLDELLREVDRRCDAGDWEGVEVIRRRSRTAIERGHQLWPAASYAEYRIALDADAELAASVITEDSGWMAPGPLTEVVAQRHTWASLAPHLEPTSRRAVVAQERVLRGEDLDAAAPGAAHGGLPTHLLGWEPDYALAEYGEDGGNFPAPVLAEPDVVLEPSPPDSGTASPDAEAGAEALGNAVRHWAARSGGSVRAVGVQGDHAAALGALGPERVRSRSADLAEVGSLLAWAAADGGAHGRRRGAAAGRLELWWCLAAICGVEDDWPTDPGPEAAELRYGLWLPIGAVTGWSCRLWVEDPLDGLAWALDASDASDGGTGSAQDTAGPNTRRV